MDFKSITQLITSQIFQMTVVQAGCSFLGDILSTGIICTFIMKSTAQEIWPVQKEFSPRVEMTINARVQYTNSLEQYFQGFPILGSLDEKPSFWEKLGFFKRLLLPF